MTAPDPWRQRIAVFLISLVIILVEIALIRELALRFWEHLAWLVISIALLGFGTSGTVLVLLHRFFGVAPPTLQFVSLLGMALSIPVCLWLGDKIDFNLIQMVWQPSIMWGLGALEMVLGIPFLFGGMFIGLALEDRPERVPGHYAASFLGSGAGGIVVLPALFLLAPRLLILGCGCVVFVTSLLYVGGKVKTGCWVASGLLLAIIMWQMPYTSKISEDKDLPQILAMPGSKTVARRYSPQGLVEVVEAPAVHAAPGLALNNVEPVPPQRLITIDAHIVGSIYNIKSLQDFAFLDHTTQAVPYQLGSFTHALIADDTGTDQVGLALFHEVGSVTALTGNGLLADLKYGEMSTYIGHIYRAPEVSLITATVRGYLRNSKNLYPLIIFPTVGTDSAGLSATATDSLLTRETLRLCFAHLADGGVLSLSTHVHSPPRESLRLLNMLVDVMRENGKEPHRHIAIIRNWATVTLVALKRPMTTAQTANIRSFCEQRGFDLVWLPDLNPMEVNRYHQLQKADYYLGAKLLLSPQNSQFVQKYVYDLSSPDDSKPFFRHFSRWWGASELTQQLGKRGRAFMELGSVLLIAALCQAFILAFSFILLPLIPVIGLPGKRKEQMVILGFFIALGVGFMLLEMDMLQRLTVYLAHPVYATATVISGFLLFGGLGSSISARLQEPLARVHCNLGIAVVVTGAAILMVIDWFLASTEGLGLPSRITLAFFLIAPLATLMGMMFPLGLKRVGRSQARIIPWAWSANGFTSVLATLIAPFLAMQWGFDLVAWTALGCYCLAAFLSRRLPG